MEDDGGGAKQGSKEGHDRHENRRDPKKSKVTAGGTLPPEGAIKRNIE